VLLPEQPVMPRFDLGDYGDGAPPVETDGTVSWRDDPDESLSDWRISVKVSDTAGTETYHVHKAMIAAGPRKSDYFSRQCRSGGGAARLAEAARCESTLTLEAEAAEAMPDFLDFVYTGELNATNENACALFHLGNYLANPALHAVVKTYIDDKLGSDTAPMYLARAHLFSLDKVVDAAVAVASEYLEEYYDGLILPGDRRFDQESWETFWDDDKLKDLYGLHPTLFARIIQNWYRIIQNWYGDSEDRLRGGLKLVADYCARRSDGIDNSFLNDVAEVFVSAVESIEDELNNYIDGNAAMPLLEMAIKYPGGENVAKLRDACIHKASEDWETALLPLVQKERTRREEAAQAAQEAATRTRAASRKKGGNKRKKTSAGSSSDQAPAAEEEAMAAPAMPLPLGPGLPAELQLQLLGNMLLIQAGEDPFPS
jgi:hypothetical protein